MEKESDREDALRMLRMLGVVNGSRVATLVTGRSSSGMTRWVRVLVAAVDEGQARVVDVTWTVARATGLSFDRKRDAIKVGGCGFDVGWHVVEALTGAMGIALGHDRM